MTDEQMDEEVRKHWKDDERNFVDELEDKDETYIEDAIESFEYRLDEIKEEYGNVKYKYDSLEVSDLKRRNEWLVKSKKLANAKSILKKLKALEIIRKKGYLKSLSFWMKGDKNITAEDLALIKEAFSNH